MQIWKMCLLKTIVILTFVACLVVARQNDSYFWFLFLLVPSFLADIVRIGGFIAVSNNQQGESEDVTDNSER